MNGHVSWKKQNKQLLTLAQLNEFMYINTRMAETVNVCSRCAMYNTPLFFILQSLIFENAAFHKFLCTNVRSGVLRNFNDNIWCITCIKIHFYLLCVTLKNNLHMKNYHNTMRRYLVGFLWVTLPGNLRIFQEKFLSWTMFIEHSKTVFQSTNSCSNVSIEFSIN